LSIPNYITFIRLFISPIFLLLYLEYEAFKISFTLLPYLLILLMAVSELSDAFDGYVARKTNQVTDLGKILDPMADSISRISVFLTFTQGVVGLPLVLVFIFIYRDSVISTLRTICALRGFALAARKSGKVKAVLQGMAAFFILLLMIPYSLNQISGETLHRLSLWVVSGVAAYTLYSGVDYIYANREHVKKLLTCSKRNVDESEAAL
jgi:CDP-diacylglycerol---glycerol-3-phosphate 3-phosphatidyltransferase